MLSPRAVCLLLLCALHHGSSRSVPLERRHVADLSFEEFDAVYLDRLPVILAGATICPSGVTLANVGSFCDSARFKPRVQGDTLHSMPDPFTHRCARAGGSGWAGLRPVAQPQTVHDVHTSVQNFVRSMGSRREGTQPPRYLFDINTFEHCPALMERVRDPPPPTHRARTHTCTRTHPNASVLRS